MSLAKMTTGTYVCLYDVRHVNEQGLPIIRSSQRNAVRVEFDLPDSHAPLRAPLVDTQQHPCFAASIGVRQTRRGYDFRRRVDHKLIANTIFVFIVPSIVVNLPISIVGSASLSLHFSVRIPCG